MRTQKNVSRAGVALAITLLLLALLAVVVVAYLGNTRGDRASSNVYANRLRAKMMAESGLSAATHLLQEHTRYGNYITAMPAPTASPAATPIRTELYRPPNADDFLTLTNGIGDALVSLATGGSGPGADPRPTPATVTASGSPASWGIPDPGLTAANSFDFNEIVRVGSNANGRLVAPGLTGSPPPAYGQWVNVRNSAGELTGRYAFFIEDESMKVNVDVAGNVSSARPNDLTTPAPTTPATQVEEVDPTGVLTSTARSGAAATLAAAGASGARFASKATIGLVPQWEVAGAAPSLVDYVHLITVHSRDDNTTARGWQRMNLNQVVASAAANNSAKAGAAQQIADWMADAWTGTTNLSSLQSHQVYGDPRLRLQFAANIVDYIDGDNTPTDLGDIGGVPVIGIERIPYLVEVDVIYTAAHTSPAAPGQAVISTTIRFNFLNMFNSDLTLGDHVSKIRVKGIPVIVKNGAVVLDREAQTFELTVGSSTLANGVIPAGGDNSASGVAGVKTFVSQAIFSQQVSYVSGGSPTQLEAGLLEVEMLGPGDERLDVVKIALRDLQARYYNSGGTAPNDFLENPTKPLATTSINASYEGVVGPSGTVVPISYGDPRYRPQIPTRRMYNLTRTDTNRFATSDDKAEIDSRAYAVDWYDYIGNRPLLFFRNGPLLSVGELGLISNCEYPWRTVYFQYAGRPESTVDANVIPSVQARRGSSAAAQSNPSLQPQDYLLADIFTTRSETTRSGGINLNSQTHVRNTAGAVIQGPFNALMLATPVGPVRDGTGANIGGSTLSVSASETLSTGLAARRIEFAPAASGGPGTSGNSPIDNTPRRPFFTIGEVASVLSRHINQNSMTPPTTSGNGRQRSTVVYSLLRGTPTNPSEWKRDYGTDMQVEEPFRKISDSITTRGNVFRVLYVGQAIKDLNKDGIATDNEKFAEYLAEAFVERLPTFAPPAVVGSSTVIKTSGSSYRIVAQRAVTE